MPKTTVKGGRSNANAKPGETGHHAVQVPEPYEPEPVAEPPAPPVPPAGRGEPGPAKPAQADSEPPEVTGTGGVRVNLGAANDG